MIYLASPYSTPIMTVLQDRVAKAQQFTLLCVQQGLPVFSPIVYFHPMAMALRLPTDAGFWHDVNMSFLRRCDVMFVLRLTGWEQSKGMLVEMNAAKILGIQQVHYDANFQPIQQTAKKPEGVAVPVRGVPAGSKDNGGLQVPGEDSSKVS
jgi:hypothetical protein